MRAIVAAIIIAVSTATHGQQLRPQSATDLAMDIFHSCLKDFDTECVTPKAMQWFHAARNQDEISLTDKLSIVRTARLEATQQERALDAREQLFIDIDNFLGSHALRIRAPEFFGTEEARAFVPDFLLHNPLTSGGMVPLVERPTNQGRGLVRKVLLPFLLGLKFKTTVLVPLALALIALKTWKAMTLGLLSLVLSGALVLFKVAKPKIVNYEVVHYPHHIEHIEHLPPHHVEHHVVPVPVPHHIEHHVEHHHVELPHHVEHVEHSAPAWDPWARSGQEQPDAQDMAFAGQRNH